MSRFFFGVLVPVLLLAIGFWAFAALGKAESKKVPPPDVDIASRLALLPEAQTESVVLLADHSETLDIVVSGNVVPFRQINIAAEVDGKVLYKASEVRSGNYISKGQVLFRIDPRDYQLSVERLESVLAQEKASVGELEQDVANIHRMLAVSKEEMALHDADLNRLQSLRDGVASRSEIDQVKRARLATVNQSTTLQNQLQTLDTRRTRLELAQRLATNQLEQARLNLARCEIVAPVDGILSQEMAQSDSYTRKGDTLAMLEDLSSVEVQCNLRVDQLMWVLDQQQSQSTGPLAPATDRTAYGLPRTPVTIEFKVTGREDLVYRWQGHLDRYDGSGMDPQSRTVPCRVVVDSPTSFTVNGEPASSMRGGGLSALVRGMFVDVAIAVQPKRMLMLVPRLGVKPGNIIWKFEADDSALPPVQTAANSSAKNSEKAATKEHAIVEAKGDEAKEPVAPDGAGASKSLVKASLRAEEWDVGYLKLLTKINVVQPLEVRRRAVKESNSSSAKNSTNGDQAEAVKYWVCDVPGGTLQAGDRVVVSPLSGIKGDNTDGLRVRKKQP